MTQIYIQSLADYNAGRIIGRWFDVSTMDSEDLKEAIQGVLEKSCEPNAEECEIAEYDGFYGLSPGLTEVLKVARLLEKYGEAYALYVHHVGASFASEEGFKDNY